MAVTCTGEGRVLRAAISGEVLNEAQENAVSSIEALLGAALPEGYTIEVSSAAQNQTTE